MFEESLICPYTGLRSFTEEESLYFKGRDEHIIQATEQLQRQKFLMLTGASGDGKSSLVYAGIIPNARAGFLKSKFSQWCVADFRPERTPFKNLANSLARQLEITNPGTVESELQHGFSALVDLYKNSSRYLDTESVAWAQGDESQKSALKRKAANLIILVDQFEEFFTNPENYHQGVPSRDSNLVLNLLLETARIAMDEDLPIYVIFTMRSDYIGQCAAFRMLPEYIGFSQFFVPRLNRSQLQQVIEEPAILSGNRITRRLTERLIHDIAEGVDQLPILQHALNQIWHAADSGKEEMDLVHYAMVGGMSSSELPDEQAQVFTKWYNTLPEKIKSFYLDPNLQNVLDAHANKLFELAAETYRQKSGKAIEDGTVREIIKCAFCCLTKIDQSRAVRNRMTLSEITSILHQPSVDSKTIGLLLDIFREPGNTFIRPFILEESSSHTLTDDDVLDITHESLIRNWELLGRWAKEEFTNYSISQDFEQQLDRWVESGKSSDFLLSMGPLTYFESWYEKVKPNAWWIARYLPEEETQKQKFDKASLILSNSQEFLRRSARKHTVTRTIIKYGPRRIVAALALLGLVVLTSFGVKNYIEQQNSFVLNKIKNESIQLAGNRKVALEDKSILLAENLRLGLVTIPEIATGINDPIDRIDALAGMATSLVLQGAQQPQHEIYLSLTLVDSLLEAIPVSVNTPRYADALREANELMVTLEFGYHFNPNERMDILVKRNAATIARWTLLIAREKPSAFTDIGNFNTGIENAVSHRAYSQSELDELLTLLSPFEKSPESNWRETKFAKEKLWEKGSGNYAYAFSGLYQELSYLYGAKGNATGALRCLDTLLKYNQKYHQRKYADMPDHAAHVAAAFYKYGQEAGMDQFVRGYCKKENVTQAEFYNRLTALGRTSQFTNYRLNYYAFDNRAYNGILEFSDHNDLSYFFRKYRKAIRNTLTSMDEMNLYTALSFKDEAVDKSMLSEHSGVKGNQEEITGLYDSAFYHYRKVSNLYLEHKILFYNNNESWPIKYLFLYPDMNTAFFPGEQRFGYVYYSSGSFLSYLIGKDLINDLYATADDLLFLENWINVCGTLPPNRFFMVRTPVDPETLSKLFKILQKSDKLKMLDLTEMYFVLGHHHAMAGQKDSALFYYQQIDISKLVSLIGNAGNSNSVMRQVGQTIGDLCRFDNFNEAHRFILAFKKPVNRSSLYAFAAQGLQLGKINSPLINQLIDSAKAEMLRVERTGVDQQSRLQYPYALAMRDLDDDLEEAATSIKNVSFKFAVQQRIARSMAFHDQLYRAYESIPPSTSKADRAVFDWSILHGTIEGNGESTVAWKDYTSYHRFWYERLLFYDDETN